MMHMFLFVLLSASNSYAYQDSFIDGLSAISEAKSNPDALVNELPLLKSPTKILSSDFRKEIINRYPMAKARQVNKVCKAIFPKCNDPVTYERVVLSSQELNLFLKVKRQGRSSG